jgi:hypothetical protein
MEIETALTQLAWSPIAAGLWLRCGVGRSDGIEEPAFSPETEPGRFNLLVGAPGELTPTVAQIGDLVRSLAPADQERLVLTMYGPEPGGDVSLAQRLADTLAVPVLAHHGLVLTQQVGPRSRVSIDAAGLPAWQPFALLSRYRPGGVGASLEKWRAPFPGALEIGPGRYWLTPDWMVEVVPAGLVVRQVFPAANPLLRVAPTDPDRVDLIVDGEDGKPLPDVMLTALGRLADALPSPARSRLRVVLAPGLPAASAKALSWAVPAPQEVRSGPA